MIRQRLRGSLGIVAILLLMALTSGLPGQALAADTGPAPRLWLVHALKGAAFSRPHDAGDNQWQALRVGAPIEPGGVVRTDGAGVVELTNGVDTIRLSPSSEVELPAPVNGSPVTRVIHWIGTAFFHVGKRPGPQFEVDTPYIVAIVKGTKFTTTVSDAGSMVKVSEGIVGVSAVTGGPSLDLTAGQSASVSATSRDTVRPGGLSGDAGPAGERGPRPSLADLGDDGVPDFERSTVSSAGGVFSAGGVASAGAAGPVAEGSGATSRSRGGGGGNGNGRGRDDPAPEGITPREQDDDNNGGGSGGGCYGHGKHHHHGNNHHQIGHDRDHDHGGNGHDHGDHGGHGH